MLCLVWVCVKVLVVKWCFWKWIWICLKLFWVLCILVKWRKWWWLIMLWSCYILWWCCKLKFCRELLKSFFICILLMKIVWRFGDCLFCMIVIYWWRNLFNWLFGILRKLLWMRNFGSWMVVRWCLLLRRIC